MTIILNNLFNDFPTRDLKLTQGSDALLQTSLDESPEVPAIEEITDQDESTNDDEKRTLGRKKQSVRDVSLELAKLHVSFKHQ